MDNNEKNKVVEIDLKHIFIILLRRIWIIALVGVMVGVVALSYAYFFVTPTYASEAKLYVNNSYEKNPGVYSPSQLVAAQYLAETYMVIMESRSVLEQVQQKTGLDYTQAQLKNMITAEAVNETEVFQVAVTCADYKHAAQIATAITEVLPDAISAVVEGSSVRVVEHAIENPNPVGPSYQKYAVIGGLLGIVLTIAVIVLIELMNTAIDSEEYLSRAYSDVPLLAVIPGDSAKNGGYKSYRGYYTSTKRGEAK